MSAPDQSLLKRQFSLARWEPSTHERQVLTQADDAAAESIQHDRQIEKAGPGRNVEPAPVKTGVMSATQRWLGLSATKLRSTRSGVWVAPSSRMVVLAPLRRLTPERPAARISRAIRLRPARMPSAARSAWMRGTPYVPFEAACATRIPACAGTSLSGQNRIGLATRGRRTLGPSIKAAGGDAQQTARSERLS